MPRRIRWILSSVIISRTDKQTYDTVGSRLISLAKSYPVFGWPGKYEKAYQLLNDHFWQPAQPVDATQALNLSAGV
jgi:hypothetical protein